MTGTAAPIPITPGDGLRPAWCLAAAPIGAGLAIAAVLVSSGSATSIATERDLLVRVDVPWVTLAVLAAGTIGGAALELASVPARLAARRSVTRELRTE
jgi:hypothetical protein